MLKANDGETRRLMPAQEGSEGYPMSCLAITFMTQQINSKNRISSTKGWANDSWMLKSVPKRRPKTCQDIIAPPLTSQEAPRWACLVTGQGANVDRLTAADDLSPKNRHFSTYAGLWTISRLYPVDSRFLELKINEFRPNGIGFEILLI